MKSAVKQALIFCIIGLYLVHASIISVQVSDGTQKPASQVGNPTSAANKGKTGVDLPFSDFKKNYAKKYVSTKEEGQRKANYDNNMAKLKSADCQPCGVNQLFDKSQTQLAGLLGKKLGTKSQSTNNARLLQTVKPSTSATPTSFNWQTYNVVTPVKNQKSCGSCWAFAATAFLESELVRRKQATKTVDLAEQFLLQCDKSSGWCNGGYIDTAIDLGQRKGMALETTYPYTSTASNYSTICSSPVIKYKFTLSNIISYWSPSVRKSDAQIITYLLQRPIAIAVNANDWVYYSPTSTNRVMKCSTTNSASGYSLNHAVLLVGYTATEWIIKNSWGTGWGVSGYIYVTRTMANNCGIGFQIDTIDFKLPAVV